MPLPDKFYDDEGNAYSADEIRAASAQQVKDESGQGSLGGLATDQENKMTSTGVTPDQGPAEVSAMVEKAKHPTAPKRELNPRHFGDFIKSNVFGGLDAGYVVGKRPMTAFDYATDVLSGYGGIDVGKRNAALQAEAGKHRLDDLRATQLGESIQNERAQRQKSNLEASKQLADEFQSIYENYDQDQWVPQMKYVAKKAGIEVPPASLAMAQRMMEKLHEAGATARDVLESPDKYAPELVNRVRHTASLFAKHVDESQKAQASAEQEKAAAKIKKGQVEGIEEATALAKTPGQRAAIKIGGSTREKVLGQLAGLPEAEPKTDVQQRRAAAIQNLTPKLGRAPNESEIQQESSRLAGEQQATTATARADATARAEMKTNAETLLRTFSDPALDHAIENTLVSTPGGTGVLPGIGAAAKSLANRPAMYFKGRAGDPDVKTLQTLPVEAIMPIIRSAGSKGFRITQSEINSFGSDAQRLASGQMGQEEARAFRDHWVKRALQIKQYADTGKQPDMTPQEKSIIAQMIKREAGSITDPGQRQKYIQQELAILKGA